MAADPNTFGYRWDPEFVKQTDSKPGLLVKLPEYFRLVKSGAKPQWVPVQAEEIPAETGLTKARFDRSERRRKPMSRRGDGELLEEARSQSRTVSVAPGGRQRGHYYWYRFADQPAMLNADMTDREREACRRAWKSSTGDGRKTGTTCPTRV